MFFVVIPRQAAITNGLKCYFTGIPCKYGHVAERYTISSHCIECAVAYRKKYYQVNRHFLIQQACEWQKQNAARVREKNRRLAKIYYWNNPEKSRQQRKDWYAKNVEKAREYAKEYHASGRGHEAHVRWKTRHPMDYALSKRASEAKRRMLKQTDRTDRHYTHRDVVDLLDKQNGMCRWCGTLAINHFEIDHIIPLSRGGTNAASNICISCRRCNRRKHGKLPTEFVASCTN